MKTATKKQLLKAAYIFESILGVIVLITVLLGTIDIIRVIYNMYIVNFSHPVNYDQFNTLLGQILLLVIGIELVIMLSLHIPGVLVEVLLYAIARKLILLPSSSTMIDVLLGVAAIAGLFAIKKYLVDKKQTTIAAHGEDEIE